MSEIKEAPYEWEQTPQFLGNILVRGKIETKSSLHIGGNQERFAIGGVTATVLRDQSTRLPYIPGSSLKGKVRSQLEYALGVVGVGAQSVKAPGPPSLDERIVRLFGMGADDKVYSSVSKKPIQKSFNFGSLTFRECYPDKPTIERWKRIDTDLLYTEIKPENSVDRLTTKANPRFPERVVKGSFFNMEIVISVFDHYTDAQELQDDLDNLVAGLRMVEERALGGSGTRGAGEIQFHLMPPIYISRDDYHTTEGGYKDSQKEIPDNGENLLSLRGNPYQIDGSRLFKSPSTEST